MNVKVVVNYRNVSMGIVVVVYSSVPRDGLRVWGGGGVGDRPQMGLFGF